MFHYCFVQQIHNNNYLYIRFEIWVAGNKLPTKCVCHLYGFSRTKVESRMSHIVDRNGHLNFNMEEVQQHRNQPHANSGQPSNRNRNNIVNISRMVTSWIDATLDGLVDKSPNSNFEYMPCYLKPTNLLTDCRHHLQVIFITYVLFFFFVNFHHLHKFLVSWH